MGANRRKIAYLGPRCNIAKGGNGSRCLAVRGHYVAKDSFARMIDRLGTRAVAAIMVLQAFEFDPVRFPLSPSKLDAIRAVAHG